MELKHFAYAFDAISKASSLLFAGYAIYAFAASTQLWSYPYIRVALGKSAIMATFISISFFVAHWIFSTVPERKQERPFSSETYGAVATIIGLVLLIGTLFKMSDYFSAAQADNPFYTVIDCLYTASKKECLMSYDEYINFTKPQSDIGKN